eukprot:gene7836-39271_t
MAKERGLLQVALMGTCPRAAAGDARDSGGGAVSAPRPIPPPGAATGDSPPPPPGGGWASLAPHAAGGGAGQLGSGESSDGAPPADPSYGWRLG